MIYSRSKHSKRCGQSSFEYAILIIIILGAFLGVSNYFKRGLSGRWKASVDDLGDQYDPLLGNSDYRHVLVSNTITTIESVDDASGFWTSRNDETNSSETKTGFEGVGSN